MQDLNDKVTGGTLTADEWNEVPSELQNISTDSGQSLTSADLNQLGKGVSGYAASGDYYVDSGTSNVITLNPATNLKAPPQYLNGMRVRFKKSASNTGAVTINVAALGSKDVVDQAESPLSSGDLVAGLAYEFYFDTTALGGTGAFIYVKPSAVANNLPIDYSPTMKVSNNSGINTALDIGTGAAKDSTNSADIIVTSVIGKDMAVDWVAGGTSGAPLGGKPSGIALSAGEWYRVFAISTPSGTVDAGIDSSITASNLLADAAGYSFFRRIGWAYYDGAQFIVIFQNGNDFAYDVPQNDVNAEAPPTVATPVPLTAPPATLAKVYARHNNTTFGSAVYALFLSNASSDTAPSATDFNLLSLAGTDGVETDQASGTTNLAIETDSGSNIQARFSSSNGNYSIMTLGYIDFFND